MNITGQVKDVLNLLIDKTLSLSLIDGTSLVGTIELYDEVFVAIKTEERQRFTTNPIEQTIIVPINSIVKIKLV
jgi:small nuclear ribonucleoprotein (snRNP)-like protein